MKWMLAVLAIWALNGCGTLPRDADQTSEEIARRKMIRVGVPTGLNLRHTLQLMAVLQHGAGAQPLISRGELEHLLLKLEDGDIDVVIGWFDKKTPWTTRVSLAPPLRSVELQERTLELRAAMRNGENRWITTVEQASRTVAGEAK
jgi:hypothetical protein